MKSLSTIIILMLILVSCGNPNTARNELLTSAIWTIEGASLDGSTKPMEKHQFLGDGRYLLESAGVKVNGNWEWSEDNVIHLKLESLTINGEVNKYDVQPGYFIKVVELTDKTLRTLESGEGDSWDSGFAKERSYASENR